MLWSCTGWGCLETKDSGPLLSSFVKLLKLTVSTITSPKASGRILLVFPWFLGSHQFWFSLAYSCIFQSLSPWSHGFSEFLSPDHFLLIRIANIGFEAQCSMTLSSLSLQRSCFKMEITLCVLNTLNLWGKTVNPLQLDTVVTYILLVRELKLK